MCGPLSKIQPREILGSQQPKEYHIDPLHPWPHVDSAGQHGRDARIPKSEK